MSEDTKLSERMSDVAAQMMATHPMKWEVRRWANEVAVVEAEVERLKRERAEATARCSALVKSVGEWADSEAARLEREDARANERRAGTGYGRLGKVLVRADGYGWSPETVQEREPRPARGRTERHMALPTLPPSRASRRDCVATGDSAMSKPGRIIYKPKGAAREYAALGANLLTGRCSHNCAYCYSNQMWDRFHADEDPTLRPKPNVLQTLARDAKRLADKREETGEQVPPIHLMFAADPYPVDRPYMHRLTRAALAILRDHDLHWQVLTKGGLPAIEDFDLYREGDSFGVTVTCGLAESVQWEPGAASPPMRLSNVYRAHEKGIATWVSCEPVIEPKWIVATIREANYVDFWRIGAWSNQPKSVVIDWPAFGRDLADVLTETSARYTIKKSLARYMPDGFSLTTEED